MDTTIEATDGRMILERMLSAAESRDLDALRPLMHEDVVMEWPQSGERFVGADNAIGAMTATEEKPDVAGEPRMFGEGDVWIMMMPLRYGSDIFHYVGVYELDGGKLRHATEFFGAPFPAQEARAPYAE
jgi:hypothetical protein